MPESWFASWERRRGAYDQALLDAFAPFRDAYERDTDDERLVDDD